MRPEDHTYPEYYGLYIPAIKESNVHDALSANTAAVVSFIAGISESKADHAYAPGKWTIKQVLSHITDTERIISYRALRFARRDAQQPLAFEENNYAANAELDNRSLKDLREEFEAVRRATSLLFRSFSDETLLLKGHTHIGETTVLALGFLICGHALHHIGVINARYLHTGEKIALN